MVTSNNPRKRVQPYKQTRNIQRPTTEVELRRRLFLTVLAIIFTLSIVIVSFNFLGPKIGSLFGLISKNRNNTGPEDTFKPPSPVFSSVPTHIKDKKITINGIAEEGSTVKLFVNGPVKETTVADQEGLFTFANIGLIEGKNSIFARATDTNGNESDKSVTYSVTVDSENPEIKLTEPANGSTVRNLDKRVKVVGTISEKATVTINKRRAIVKPDLTFELVLGVEEGNVEIKVIATDEAGNKKEENYYITYVRGS